MKSYFSLKECSDLRRNIKNYAQTDSTKEEIEEEFEECQQFYKELSMINQFFGQPLDMPPPDYCFSQLTYPLAICLSRSKNIWKDIKKFCSDNELLIEFIKELYDFFVTSITSSQGRRDGFEMG